MDLPEKIIDLISSKPLELGTWLIVGLSILVGASTAFYRFLQTDQSLNLRSPNESRIHTRLKFLDERIDRITDGKTKDTLVHERDRLSFQLCMGVDASESYQNKLYSIYKSSSSSMSWRDVKRASGLLKYRNGNFVKGQDKSDLIWGWICLIFGILCMSLGFLAFVAMGITYGFSKGVAIFDWLKAGIFYPGVISGLGLLTLEMGTPFFRARQIQKWLPDPTNP